MCQILEVTLKNGLLRTELNFSKARTASDKGRGYPGLTYNHFLDCSAT